MKIPRRVGQAETRPPLQHSSRKIASSRPDQLGEVELSAVDAFPHPLHAFTRPPVCTENFIRIDAVQAGRPLPYGTVLVRPVYDVLRDTRGAPAKDTNGQLTKTKLLFISVMEKRAGWGREFPAGEWKFQAFAPDGTPLAKPSPSNCFACHSKVQSQDFVFSFDRMKTPKQHLGSLADIKLIAMAIFSQAHTFGSAK